MRHIIGIRYFSVLFVTVFLCCIRTSAQVREGVSLTYSLYSTQDSAIVFSLVRQGLALVDHSPEKAMHLFQRAERIGRLSGFYDGIGYALAFMGLAASQLGDYEVSQAYYQEAMPYCIHARDCKFVIAYLYQNIALSAKEQGDYLRANEYFHKALNTFQQYLPAEKNSIAIYINLIGIQARRGSYQQALAYADRAIQLATVHAKKQYLSIALLNKANTYQVMKQADSALHYYQDGLKTATSLGNKSLYSSFHLGLGNIALQQKDYRTAAGYLEQAIHMDKTESSGILFGYILPRYSLGLAYHHLKSYPKAEKVLLEGLAMAKTTGLTENEYDGHGVLADVYEATGRYKEAMQQATLYRRIKDSANHLEQIRAINEIEIKYQTAQKNKELLETKMLIARQEKTIYRKNMALTGIAGTTLFLCISGIVWYGSRKKIRKRNEEILRLKAAAAGEDNERARISRELHDGIGGMLTGIKMNLRTLQKQTDTTVLPARLDTIMEQLHGMGDEIRKTAHNLMPDVLLDHDLEEALTSYCRSLSTEHLKINLHYTAPAAFEDKSFELSVYRIVQELVQNIVKHAQASLAEIQISRLKDMLYISAEDNGIGFDSEQGQGIGLSNIKSRVYTLDGRYAMSSSPGKGSTAFIEIRLKNETSQ